MVIMNFVWATALTRSVHRVCKWSRRDSLFNVLVRSASQVSDKQSIEQRKSVLDEKKSGSSMKIGLGNGHTSITSLEEARRLSKRRNMMLVKTGDDTTKSEQRPADKLLTTAVALSKDSTSKSEYQAKKQEKLLNIGSRIADHDLASRIKNISKWLQKGNEVRVLIHGTHEKDPGIEKISKAIESAASDVGGRIINRVDKGGNVKFSILPPHCSFGVDKETA